MSRDHWISAAEWTVIAVMIALDAAFSASTGIAVSGAAASAKLLGIIILLWPALFLASRASGLARESVFLAEIPGKVLTYILVCSVLEYYLATSPAPLHDALMIRGDVALGVSWPELCRWGQAHPQLREALQLPYFSLGAESLGVLLVISLFYPRRARRFSTALILSSVLTIPFLWFFPVGGPFSVYRNADLPQACFSYAVSGTEHYLAMREHSLAAIRLDDIRGIIAFPSYHAAAAVLLTYFLRGIPLLFPAALVFNGLMIAATPLIGGHYVVDVLAGLVIAAITLCSVERLEAGQAAERAALWPEAAPERA
jgi:membrane-associated phospholipid phosphatase